MAEILTKMCRRICKLATMLLSHTDKSVFYTSPWFEDQTPFVVYRGLAAIFTFLVLQGNMVVLNITSNFGWFLKFTHWGFVALTAHMCVSAAICLREHVKGGRDNHDDFYDDSAEGAREDDDFYRNGPNDEMEQSLLTSERSLPTSRHRQQNRNSLPWYIKLDWALYDISCTHALTISILYYSAMGGDTSTNNSWLLHIMNSVIVVTDVLICGIPTRIAHVIYPLLYMVTYLLFVYWISSLDGFKKYGQVYAFLDFAGKTKRTAYMIVAMIIFVVPAFHLVVYVLYRCRLALLRMLKGGGVKTDNGCGKRDAQTQTEPQV
ncbi:uncharacterized protein LOC118416055 [Branchiostoma floridae]|uniref:Uncharacterized protein LOC118416055 n=1 Tax=Branchiostoma floridae TaxID=7739 RepID=A0A9J7MRX4_BRAFL|nr:uncharacterized protein LOC118416055 [Branchiostoma floridae]